MGGAGAAVAGAFASGTVWSNRDIVEALLYLLRGGLPWRMLPPNLFPPMTTVQHYFYRWRDIGLWPSINHALLIVTAKMNDADPHAWLADVLARVAELPQSRLRELLPWNWKAARQTAQAA